MLMFRGERYQPWAASSNGASPSAGYANPPEIFKAAGMKVSDWRYRIYVSGGVYQVVATPVGKLAIDKPSSTQVKATRCYIHYAWQRSGKPFVELVDTGC